MLPVARDQRVTVKCRAAGTITDPQVRDRGTIGGSLAHGDPAADLPAVLLIAEGSVTLRGPAGERSVAAADLFQDYLETAVGADEVMTDIPASVLRRLGLRLREVQPPQRGLGDGRGGARQELRWRSRGGPRRADEHGVDAARASAVEDALRGQPLSKETIAKAAEEAAEGTDPPADLNASAEYKQHLARVLTRRALEEAAGLS